MEESIESARDELKRVDHLFYVSLKYTRTVDMMRHMIERLIKSIQFSIEALLEFAKSKKRIMDIPQNVALRAKEASQLYKEDGRIQEMIQLYTLLMKLRRASYTSREEFRRHVTMTATIDGDEIVEVNIDVLGEYYNQTKDFFDYTKNFIRGTLNE